MSLGNLESGATYVIKGKLVDAKTGEELASASKKITADKKTAASELTFEVNATGLEGKDLVCTEELLRDEVVVASHKDLGDKGQTISVPRIHTTAQDGTDGDHEAEATGDATIIDTVEWEGLVP